MNLIHNKPYNPIWIAIPPLIGLAILGSNSGIDLQLDDTYFVIALTHIGIFFSIVLGIIGFLYWLTTNKKLINWMTGLHVSVTISTFFLFMIAGLIFKKLIGIDFGKFREINQILLVTILIMVLSQLIFIINLLINLIRNKVNNLI
jgi:heme/copper-type cytochrome/quinol oxidase subunit 1